MVGKTPVITNTGHSSGCGGPMIEPTDPLWWKVFISIVVVTVCVLTLLVCLWALYQFVVRPVLEMFGLIKRNWWDF
jgi:hypothetical protein